VWRKFVGKDGVAEYEQRYDVISTRRLAGKTLIHIHGASPSEVGFEPVTPDLEDVYFLAIKRKSAAI
jgi:hypothetical protein